MVSTSGWRVRGIHKSMIGRRDVALELKTPQKQGVAPRLEIGRKIGNNGG